MCFIRKALDWVFTQTELKWLDDIMPEIHKREKEDKNKEFEQKQKEEEVWARVQSLYNTPHYNMNLVMLWLPNFYFTMEFYKGIIG